MVREISSLVFEITANLGHGVVSKVVIDANHKISQLKGSARVYYGGKVLAEQSYSPGGVIDVASLDLTGVEEIEVNFE